MRQIEAFEFGQREELQHLRIVHPRSSQAHCNNVPARVRLDLTPELTDPSVINASLQRARAEKKDKHPHGDTYRCRREGSADSLSQKMLHCGREDLIRWCPRSEISV